MINDIRQAIVGGGGIPNAVIFVHFTAVEMTPGK